MHLAWCGYLALAASPAAEVPLGGGRAPDETPSLKQLLGGGKAEAPVEKADAVDPQRPPTCTCKAMVGDEFDLSPLARMLLDSWRRPEDKGAKAPEDLCDIPCDRANKLLEEWGYWQLLEPESQHLPEIEKVLSEKKLEKETLLADKHLLRWALNVHHDGRVHPEEMITAKWFAQHAEDTEKQEILTVQLKGDSDSSPLFYTYLLNDGVAAAELKDQRKLNFVEFTSACLFARYANAHFEGVGVASSGRRIHYGAYLKLAEGENAQSRFDPQKQQRLFDAAVGFILADVPRSSELSFIEFVTLRTFAALQPQRNDNAGGTGPGRQLFTVPCADSRLSRYFSSFDLADRAACPGGANTELDVDGDSLVSVTDAIAWLRWTRGGQWAWAHAQDSDDGHSDEADADAERNPIPMPAPCVISNHESVSADHYIACMHFRAEAALSVARKWWVFSFSQVGDVDLEFTVDELDEFATFFGLTGTMRGDYRTRVRVEGLDKWAKPDDSEEEIKRKLKQRFADVGLSVAEVSLEFANGRYAFVIFTKEEDVERALAQSKKWQDLTVTSGSVDQRDEQKLEKGSLQGVTLIDAVYDFVPSDNTTMRLPDLFASYKAPADKDADAIGFAGLRPESVPGQLEIQDAPFVPLLTHDAKIGVLGEMAWSRTLHVSMGEFVALCVFAKYMDTRDRPAIVYSRYQELREAEGKKDDWKGHFTMLDVTHRKSIRWSEWYPYAMYNSHTSDNRLRDGPQRGLDKGQFEKLLHQIGVARLHQCKSDQTFQLADVDGDGHLELGEFLSFIKFLGIAAGNTMQISVEEFMRAYSWWDEAPEMPDAARGLPKRAFFDLRGTHRTVDLRGWSSWVDFLRMDAAYQLVVSRDDWLVVQGRDKERESESASAIQLPWKLLASEEGSLTFYRFIAAQDFLTLVKRYASDPAAAIEQLAQMSLSFQMLDEEFRIFQRWEDGLDDGSRDAWEMFRIFDVNEDGKWDFFEYLTVATWRHLLARDDLEIVQGVDAGVGDGGVSTTAWRASVVEGIDFGHEQSATTMSILQKCQASGKGTESCVQSTAQKVDVDGDGRVSPLEFAAFMFVLRYADESQWFVQNSEFVQLLPYDKGCREGRGPRTSRACTLRLLYGAWEDHDLGHIYTQEYTVYHLFYVKMAPLGNVADELRAVEDVERQRRDEEAVQRGVELGGSRLYFFEWVALWSFLRADGTSVRLDCGPLLSEVLDPHTQRTLSYEKFMKFPFLPRESECEADDNGKMHNMLTRDVEVLLFNLLNIFHEKKLRVGDDKLDFAAFVAKYFQKLPAEVQENAEFAMLFRRDQSLTGDKWHLLDLPPGIRLKDVNVAKIFPDKCEGRVESFKLLLFDTLDVPKMPTRKVDGFVKFKDVRSLFGYLLFGKKFGSLSCQADWKDALLHRGDQYEIAAKILGDHALKEFPWREHDSDRMDFPAFVQFMNDATSQHTKTTPELETLASPCPADHPAENVDDGHTVELMREETSHEWSPNATASVFSDKFEDSESTAKDTSKELSANHASDRENDAEEREDLSSGTVDDKDAAPVFSDASQVPEPAAKDTVELSMDKHVVDLSKDKDAVEPSKDKDVVEPSKDKDVVDLSKDKDVVDLSKDKDVVDLSKDKDVVDLSKDKDVVDLSKDKPKDAVEPSKSSTNATAPAFSDNYENSESTAEVPEESEPEEWTEKSGLAKVPEEEWTEKSGLAKVPEEERTEKSGQAKVPEESEPEESDEEYPPEVSDEEVSDEESEDVSDDVSAEHPTESKPKRLLDKGRPLDYSSKPARAKHRAPPEHDAQPRARGRIAARSKALHQRGHQALEAEEPADHAPEESHDPALEEW